MGFEWARPTTFAEPMLIVGAGLHYYRVDHSPSYLWNSATWEISEALFPHLRTVMRGPTAWASDETIGRAIEIRSGIIQNAKILSFQDRSPNFRMRNQLERTCGESRFSGVDNKQASATSRSHLE